MLSISVTKNNSNQIMIQYRMLNRVPLLIQANQTNDEVRLRMERAFSKTHKLRPEEIRHLLFKRCNKVYDVDLDITYGKFIIRKSSYLPEKETKLYMDKLKCITDDLNRWDVGHVVKARLEEIEPEDMQNGQVFIDLGVGPEDNMRRKEFDL